MATHASTASSSDPASANPKGPPAAGGGKASAATYGAIDSSSVSTSMWMARIPSKLASVWKNAPDGTVLGTLTFTKGSPPAGKGSAAANRTNRRTNGGSNAGGGPVKQSLTIKVPKSFTEKVPDLPLDYSAEAMTKKVPVLHPFTRRPDGSVALQGTVARSCSLQMIRTDRYKEMCKNRMVNSVTTDRFVKPVDQVDLSVRSRPVGAAAGKGGGGFGDSIAHFGKGMIEARERAATDPTGQKRKFQDQPIRSVLFELFSSQQYWTVKELRNTSGRLEKDIRSVLSELCEFHRSGEYKGSWELRSEFRSQDESAGVEKAS
uniref:TFIIF beta subunit HTH domain-containing protein n=1 Tax=Odontella aurita TaxID=265563 RepID=A0A7S4J172_9STRA|mmetsp:Transcript_35443/g.105835  ORF Transcript_35443/g.105835 Transcript_35443/m.105835 type:complete len:319 (+) Transcript_35443:53-1009(+)|eukprot:CAMPEP_0113551072 /NCGR_PEP_ID=MMETSP0015_2-20120614/14325_1 /TAXON_ID=2838 /ORGANISM="Odontella" /LENGTH=318 /DNA_ID=CAMNT_0000451931 /DNA_START=53 /DNA_END=1009 /DNA_ORIENTATION=+ /assembly_acc=CAM_ASM_000160